MSWSSSKHLNSEDPLFSLWQVSCASNKFGSSAAALPVIWMTLGFLKTHLLGASPPSVPLLVCRFWVLYNSSTELILQYSQIIHILRIRPASFWFYPDQHSLLTWFHIIQALVVELYKLTDQQGGISQNQLITNSSLKWGWAFF